MDYSIFEDKNRLERFKSLVNKYEINHNFAFRLRQIEGFDLVMILDDSTSMTTPIINQTPTHRSPFHQLPTRWDELKHIVSIVVDLASTLDPDGIDIYFLNRPPLLHVSNSSQLDETFAKLPHGSTPLVRTLHEVLNLRRSQTTERKLLILIATDGLPTDEHGRNDLQNLETILRNNRYPSTERIYITFLACTNDLQSVGYLNRFDKQIPFVDVLDDYQSERAEVLRVQGKHFPFSYGDYVVKLLMGSIDQWFDQLDEKKVQVNNTNVRRQHRLTREKNCVIS